jgi:hypothetical protein
MTNSTVRGSGRIPREIPSLLIGSDAEGTVFSEETKTVMISLHGAGIVSTHTLVSEQELNLRLLESNREAEPVLSAKSARKIASTLTVLPSSIPRSISGRFLFLLLPLMNLCSLRFSSRAPVATPTFPCSRATSKPMFALFTVAWCAIAAIVDSPPCGSAAPGYPPEAPR